ncbi:inovirus Gp2 family protein [Undibacterium sp. RTI2.1]|uniref:inovirus Gp2 family protein n=1 Tax=unclassified Undibacterium TaxID=2630295 RepID=UPI002B23CBB4|nr:MULTISPECIES: inovirus Gp2 family protein [unclassified Undibacterium]MEB0030195.1 inovirus Gp2 family protein [Undibacterium sp. RTI2.1]MEB0116819.1 inovirus Gp2 family protein [Undibacterium sp. RTI2.2]
MIRHPLNSNLSLHHDNHFLGLPVQIDKGPLIIEYLDRLYQTMSRTLGQYRRVFAFRFDLRLPATLNLYDLSYENEFIDRFIESFKAKIRHNRQMAFRENKYAHDSVVRYVWTREVGQHGRPHYHFVIFLNYDAFCSLGKYSSGRNNMYNRLQDAWASALRLTTNDSKGLVEIPLNPYYHMQRDEHQTIAKFFYRASYLCKAATKSFGNGAHGFGASRI